MANQYFQENTLLSLFFIFYSSFSTQEVILKKINLFNKAYYYDLVLVLRQ